MAQYQQADAVHGFAPRMYVYTTRPGRVFTK